jgi:cell division septation protein DedD
MCAEGAMARKEQGDGFWPRIIITMVVVIWAAILGGSWLGHRIVEKQRSGEDTSQALNIPTPRPRPWKTADPAIQKEVDEQRAGGALERSPIPTITASPVKASPTAAAVPALSPSPEASPEPSFDSSPTPEASTPSPRPTERPQPTPVAAPPSPSVPEEPVPTPAVAASDSYQLQFGSFSNEANARERAEQLLAQGQEVHIDEIQTEQGVFYRVRGGVFNAEAEARNQAEHLRALGVEVYVVGGRR